MAVEFDLQGMKDRLAQRPMTQAYAAGLVRIIAEGEQNGIGETAGAVALLPQILADDPIPDYLADQVAQLALGNLTAGNETSQRLQDAIDSTLWQTVVAPIGNAVGGALDTVTTVALALGVLLLIVWATRKG